MGIKQVAGFAVLAGLGFMLWPRSARAIPSRGVLRQSSPDLGYGELLASAPGSGGGGFVPVSTGGGGSGAPIWEVAKNPGNLRYSRANDWLGQVGEYRGFAVFSAYEYGIRAMSIVIVKDIGAGKTLRQIIAEYAPPHENDTGGYLNNVAMASGIAPDSVPVMGKLVPLLRAMIRIETGRDFDLALVSRGVSMMSYA